MTHAVEVSGLCVGTGSGGRLLHDVSFSLGEGERVALVGASGSGKSLTAASVLGTLPHTLRPSGHVRVCGRTVRAGRFPRTRARVAAVHQDASTALNPLIRIGDQFALVLRAHGVASSRVPAVTADLLGQVGFDEPGPVCRAYPAELSGGQRQRICLAIALACRPLLLVADEPTTALDVHTQDQALAAIEHVRQRHGTALLLITHDDRVAAGSTDRTLRMVTGRLADQECQS